VRRAASGDSSEAGTRTASDVNELELSISESEDLAEENEMNKVEISEPKEKVYIGHAGRSKTNAEKQPTFVFASQDGMGCFVRGPYNHICYIRKAMRSSFFA
jgi:hypothetical protein